MKQIRAREKEGELSLKYKIQKLPFLLSAAAALPVPAVLFSLALFAVGDLASSIPDTMPGVALCHSVAITGASKEPFVMLLQSRLLFN